MRQGRMLRQLVSAQRLSHGLAQVRVHVRPAVHVVVAAGLRQQWAGQAVAGQAQRYWPAAGPFNAYAARATEQSETVSSQN